MNREEFFEKYGDVKVKFSSYYKYSFKFSNEELNIIIYLGGTSEDIYRFEVKANKEYAITELDPISAYVDNQKIE